MRKTERVSETTDESSAGTAMHEATPAVPAGVPPIEKLIRLARIWSHGVAAGEDANGAASPHGRRPDQASDAARSSTDAGITRGASLWFGGRR